MKKHIIAMALLLLIAVFGLPAAANYSYDGSELTTNASGTVYGDVYVGVGDNDNHATAKVTNYTTNYTLPKGIDVQWARVYVDAWCGNEYHIGWINVSFNGGPWQKVFYNGTNDTNTSCWGSGHGVVLAGFYQDASNFTAGMTQRAAVRSTVFNGRVYRAVLVCAYNDTDGCKHNSTNYWVNNGNYNLHYAGPSGTMPVTDNTTTYFNGTALNATSWAGVRGMELERCAKLTTVYHASGGGPYGGSPEPDYAYFNVIPTRTDHSPYYENKFHYLGYDDDYADEQQWTLKTECLHRNMINVTDNNLTFWRGRNASNGLIYHNSSWGEPAGAEGEAYLHPMLAVLAVRSEPNSYLTKNIVGSYKDNPISLPWTDCECTQTALSSLGLNPGTDTVYRWDPLYGWQDEYNGHICPGIGYSLSIGGADRTLTWTAPQNR